MTATDWTAAKCAELEADIGRALVPFRAFLEVNGLVFGEPVTALLERAMLALQTQRNLLAAANAENTDLRAVVADMAARLAVIELADREVMRQTEGEQVTQPMGIFEAARLAETERQLEEANKQLLAERARIRP